MIASRMTVLCCGCVCSDAKMTEMSDDSGHGHGHHNHSPSTLASLTVVSSNANRLKRTITSSMPASGWAARLLLLLVVTGME